MFEGEQWTIDSEAELNTDNISNSNADTKVWSIIPCIQVGYVLTLEIYWLTVLTIYNTKDAV